MFASRLLLRTLSQSLTSSRGSLQQCSGVLASDLLLGGSQLAPRLSTSVAPSSSSSSSTSRGTRSFELRRAGAAFPSTLSTGRLAFSTSPLAAISCCASSSSSSSSSSEASTTISEPTLGEIVEETVKQAPAEQPIIGETKTMEFQAETRKLLDIVARSLYSEREVFVRELISNASDALEKLRHRKVLGEAVADPDVAEEIHIFTDELENTLTIQDFGIGMQQDELIKNLGTIAHSGTGEFLAQLGGSQSGTDLIGQFGVGFYSAFMVADRVTVFTKSAVPGSPALRWISDGTGSYEVSECLSGVEQGTKIVLSLKPGATEFSKATTIQDVIKRYSSFVRCSIKLNGKVANSLQALWTKPKGEITDSEHQEFYQFIARSYDKPMYHLHFSTDTPLHIQSLFYVPGQHSEKYGMGRMDPGVALYSRRVMIQAAAKGLLPDWLRFIKGIVDSEDIPLNLSRELLQDSAVIQKLNTVLTRRILKHLADMAQTDADQYDKFFAEFGNFLKEGVCTDSKWKEELGKLLRFESSELPARKLCSFDDYISRMKPDQKEIYYLVVSSRNFAEASPYYEGFQRRGWEVLFLYTSLDDFVMGNLQMYSGKRLVSIESAESFSSSTEEETSKPTENPDFSNWLLDVLDEKVSQIKTSSRLVNSPAVIVDHESASFRRMMSMVDPNRAPKLPKQILEYNPTHPIIVKLQETRLSNPKLAALVAEQIFDDALISAGLLEDPRVMIPRLNSILEQALSDPSSSNNRVQDSSN